MYFLQDQVINWILAFPQNSSSETRVAHPGFSREIDSSDDRIGKATLRAMPISSSGLTSDRDVWVFKSNTAAISNYKKWRANINLCWG